MNDGGQHSNSETVFLARLEMFLANSNTVLKIDGPLYKIQHTQRVDTVPQKFSIFIESLTTPINIFLFQMSLYASRKATTFLTVIGVMKSLKNKLGFNQSFIRILMANERRDSIS